MKWIWIILIFLIGLSLGMFLGIFNLIKIKSFELEPVHLIQTMAALIIASYIAFEIKIKGDYSVKTREAIISIANDFVSYVSSAHSDFIEYSKLRTPEAESRILAQMTMASSTLHTLVEVCKRNDTKGYTDKMAKAFEVYNDKLTDSPFKTSAQYSINTINIIMNRYQAVINEANKMKVELFSA